MTIALELNYVKWDHKEKKTSNNTEKRCEFSLTEREREQSCWTEELSTQLQVIIFIQHAISLNVTLGLGSVGTVLIIIIAAYA